MGPGIGAPRSLARADLPGPVYTLPPTHPQTSTQRGNFGLNNVMCKFAQTRTGHNGLVQSCGYAKPPLGLRVARRRSRVRDAPKAPSQGASKTPLPPPTQGGRRRLRPHFYSERGVEDSAPAIFTGRSHRLRPSPRCRSAPRPPPPNRGVEDSAPGVFTGRSHRLRPFPPPSIRSSASTAYRGVEDSAPGLFTGRSHRLRPFPPPPIPSSPSTTQSGRRGLRPRTLYRAQPQASPFPLLSIRPTTSKASRGVEDSAPGVSTGRSHRLRPFPPAINPLLDPHGL
jgi:hypothetical protein